MARRDLAKLKTLLREQTFNPHEYKRKVILAGLDISVFDLAMGWREGTEELLTRLAPTSADVETAIYVDDQVSLDLLWHSLCEPLDHSMVFKLLLRVSDRAFEQVADLLQKSCLKLAQFAMVCLNDDEKDRLCLRSHCPKSWKILDTWTTLRDRELSVPLRYAPIQKCFLFDLLSFNGAIWRYCHLDEPSEHEAVRSASQVLQRYCELGFLDINWKGAYTSSMGQVIVEMPFLNFLRSFDHDNIRSAGGNCFARFSEICRWFLSNGASTHDLDKHRPNLLFFLARFVGLDDWHDDRFYQHRVRPKGYSSIDLQDDQQIWNPALEDSSADQKDTCQCPCSVEGCLPSRLFLEPDKMDFDYSWCYDVRVPRYVLDMRLLRWLQLCQLSDEQKARYVEDAVRLEVFERLGMTHTCCVVAANHRADDAQSVGPWSEDADEIRSEESELEAHLNLIMEAYASFSRTIEVWDADWVGWWKLLDGILPDLSGLSDPKRFDYLGKEDLEYEIKFREMGHERAVLEAATLKFNGYDALDFMVVIRLHFSKYLQGEDVEAAP